jgi:hypothetical protein
MELKIAQVEIPEIIEFNYEELKNEISAKAHDYEVMVYTEDKIKEAKADKAALNKLKKALNDERIKQEKEYMKPFNEFKSQINEIISIIDKPVAIIDTQIKEYDNKKAQEKEEAIKLIWMNTQNKPDFLLLGSIWNPKWTNATFTLKKIEEEINERIAGINADITTLKSLEAFSFEALEDYKQHLDLGHAVAEGQRLADIQRRKLEEEQQRALEASKKPVESVAEEIPYEAPKVLSEAPQPPQKEETAQWIGFEALLTVEKALKLKQFFSDNNITFRSIGK